MSQVEFKAVVDKEGHVTRAPTGCKPSILEKIHVLDFTLYVMSRQLYSSCIIETFFEDSK